MTFTVLLHFSEIVRFLPSTLPYQLQTFLTCHLFMLPIVLSYGSFTNYMGYMALVAPEQAILTSLPSYILLLSFKIIF